MKKFCSFRYRRPPGHQTDLRKIEPPHGILSLKKQAQRTGREKKQIMYKGKSIKIIADFQQEP
jgi:hypothetical protein